MEPNYKICLVGVSSAGKTSLIRRLVDNEFDQDEKPTLNHTTTDFTIETEDGTMVKLSLADRGGEASLSSGTQTFYRAADCILQVFAKNNQASVTALQELNTEAASAVKKPDDVIFVLVGTKADEESKVDIEELDDEFADEGMIFESVSAKEGSSVFEMFKAIATKLHEENS